MTKYIFLTLILALSFAVEAQNAEVMKNMVPAFGGSVAHISQDGSASISLAIIEPASNELYSRVKSDEKAVDFTGADGLVVKAQRKHTSQSHCIERPDKDGSKNLYICYFKMAADGNFSEFTDEGLKAPAADIKPGNVILAKYDDQVVLVITGLMATQIYNTLTIPEKTRLWLGSMTTQAYKIGNSIVCQNEADAQNQNPKNYQCFVSINQNSEVQKLDQDAIQNSGNFSKFLFGPLPIQK